MAVYRFVLHLNNELVLNWHNSTLNAILYMNTFNNTAIQLWNGTNQSFMPLFLKHIIKCMECCGPCKIYFKKTFDKIDLCHTI